MLRNSGLRQRKKEDEMNPMDGIANLVDIMLVFSCGLMVSIILHWNVNLTNVTTILDQDQLKQIDEDIEVVSQDGDIVGNYKSMGVVVVDPKTGKMYVIQENDK